MKLFDDFIKIGNIPIMIKSAESSSYDFAFRNVFSCSTVVDAIDEPVLLRIGAIEDYDKVKEFLAELDIQLLCSKEEHERCSELEQWYPLLKEYTPFSKVYDRIPPIETMKRDFSFPIFVKGSRQTNRHKRSQCIINNEQEYSRLCLEWNRDPVLHWQKAVIRKFVPLEVVDATSFPEIVPISFEFRLFFWKKQFVAKGAYWKFGPEYHLNECDFGEVMRLSQRIADIIDVPFLAIDVAKTQSGEWIAIEVNDGQESGHNGVNPIELWSAILRLEK